MNFPLVTVSLLPLLSGIGARRHYGPLDCRKMRDYRLLCRRNKVLFLQRDAMLLE
jgi:hypothetical protein